MTFEKSRHFFSTARTDRPQSMLLSDRTPPTRVFLSYSRKDHAVCKELHADLVRQGLEVRIDVENIPPGEELQPTIRELIDTSDCSIVVLSKNSLNSFWVFWELRRRFEIQEFQERSKIIPVYLDQSYLDDAFIGQVDRWIQSEVALLAQQAFDLNMQGTASDHLDTKKRNFLQFKQHLSGTIDRIRAINAIDLRKDSYNKGFRSLYAAITGLSDLVDDTIGPSTLDNTDIELRVNEIEHLVQDDLKEAAKRTIDFARDFYPSDVRRRKSAVMISTNLNLCEKYLKEGKEIDKKKEELNLAEMILDLIYDAMPKPA